MLKVHKGRRDDVRTVHGSLPGLTHSLLILSVSVADGQKRTGRTTILQGAGPSRHLPPFHAMPKPETTVFFFSFTFETSHIVKEWDQYTPCHDGIKGIVLPVIFLIDKI